MKKYIKPSMEIYPINAYSPLMDSLNNEPGYSGEYLSKGRKDIEPDDEPTTNW